MILDALAQITVAAPLDLEAVRPGPGEPIVLTAVGQTPGAVITITTADDNAGAPGTPAGLTTATVGADGSVQFELPSTAKQWVITDTDTIHVVLKNAQTNL